jgi:hypothetical protein
MVKPTFGLHHLISCLYPRLGLNRVSCSGIYDLSLCINFIFLGASWTWSKGQILRPLKNIPKKPRVSAESQLQPAYLVLHVLIMF